MGLIEDAVKRGQQTRTASRSGSVIDRKFSRSPAFSADLSKTPRLQIDPQHAFENRLICGQQDRAIVATYKMMRTRISQRMDSNNWSSIAVTATRKGDGKSLTAINLALSLATQPDQSVFLVDFDLRNNSIGKYLGIGHHSHLLDVLEGKMGLDEALVAVGEENLYVLLNDTVVDKSSELLTTQEMIALVKSLNRLGGTVIYDLPPLFMTDDFLAFAVHVDCTLLVIAESQTDRNDIEKATELLGGFDLLGVVLNKSRDTAEGYY